jgi:hypothetical protein
VLTHQSSPEPLPLTTFFLSVFLNKVTFTNCQGHVRLDSEFAMFYSKSNNHICHAFTWIETPQHNIKLFLNFANNRQLATITAFALPPMIPSEKEISQKGVKSPLIWQLSYYICLARNRQEFSVFKFCPSLCYPKLY